MNALLLSLLLTAVAAGLVAGKEPRPHKECFGASDISCSAYHDLAILSHGSDCTGTGRADCQVVSDAHQKYVAALAGWWREGDADSFCDARLRSSAARLVASAVSEVWSSAKAQLACAGREEACGYSFQSPDEYADVVSESLAQAAAQVVSESGSNGFCFADVRKVANALGEGTKAADLVACEDGSGSHETWKASYVDSVAFHLDAALAAAVSSVCRGRQSRHLTWEVGASLCEGASEYEDAPALGNICGGVDSDLPECGGEGGFACCGQDEGLSHCECEDCEGPWVRKSKVGSAMRIYEDKNKHRCTCQFKDKCVGAPEYGCEVYSELKITATSGRCKGEASANCKTVSHAVDAYRSAFQEWFSEEGAICDSGKAETAAEAIGTAAAEVYADASVKIECEGEGFGCGWGASSGAAWATAFAEAVAISAARAHDPHHNSKGACFSDIRALSSVIAEVAAKTQVMACSDGEDVNVFKKSLGKAIGQAVAKAFSSATANSCTTGGEQQASSSCKGEAESTSTDTLYEQGNVCAGIKTNKPCTGGGQSMCCASGFTSYYCFCENAGCENSPWVKVSEAGAAKTAFRDQAGTTCYCM